MRKIGRFGSGAFALFHAAGMLVFAPAAPVSGQETPPGEAVDGARILELARSSYALQDYKLNGHMWRGIGIKRTPFSLTMEGGAVRFQFKDPLQIVLLKMENAGASLYERVGDEVAEVPTERYGQRVRGFDLSYEDLAMRFLYWPMAQWLGDETVSTRRCWKLEVRNPDGFGSYERVLLWIEQGGGALMRMQGFDAQDRLVRELKVRSVQQIAGAWVLKLMRVERYDPESGKRLGMTYLEIEDGKKKKGLFKK
ncbi:MAG: outer membrane lipoprotein-sorting protein [Verrucomicrobiales bacterium]